MLLGDENEEVNVSPFVDQVDPPADFLVSRVTAFAGEDDDTAETSELQNHVVVPEPSLLFHPTRFEDSDINPLRGLVNHGPYSRALVNSVIDPIRVAAVLPAGASKVVRGLLDESGSRARPCERREYLSRMARVLGRLRT